MLPQHFLQPRSKPEPEPNSHSRKARKAWGSYRKTAANYNNLFHEVNGKKPSLKKVQGEAEWCSWSGYTLCWSIIHPVCALQKQQQSSNGSRLVSHHDSYSIISPHWDLLLRRSFLSKYYYVLAMHLFSQEPCWGHATTFMLFLLPLTQHPFCKQYVKGWLSSFSIVEIL